VAAASVAAAFRRVDPAKLAAYVNALEDKRKSSLAQIITLTLSNRCYRLN
jgi:hypothetical protein